MTRDGLLVALKHVVIAVAVVVCLWRSTLLFLHYAEWSKFSNDFGVYWRAANQAFGEVYFWDGRFPFPYMPTMLLWTTPLQFVPKWPAYFVFISCSIAAFVWAIRPYLTKPQIALVLTSPALLRGIFTGQVCAALSAVLIWACGTKNRLYAGLALGLIATIKPQLVFMAPLMLISNKDWLALRAAATAFVTTVLVSFIMLGGPVRWYEWARSMDHFRRMVVDYDVINVAASPASIAERFGYAPLPFLILGIFLGAVLVYLCRDKGPLETASAIAAGSILASPYALVYDLTALLPLFVLSVWRGNLLAVPALAGMYNPWPLIVSLFLLVKVKVGLPKIGARHAAV